MPEMPAWEMVRRLLHWMAGEGLGPGDAGRAEGVSTTCSARRPIRVPSVVRAWEGGPGAAHGARHL